MPKSSSALSQPRAPIPPEPLPLSGGGANTAPVTQSPDVPDTGKAPSKQSQVLALLRREQGATLNDIVTATAWQPHTARAALTGLRKKGHAIESRRADKLTTYFLA